MNLQHVQQWCQLHGYTDPHTVESHWYAFPPNAVMPVDIDKQTRTLWCLPYQHTVSLALAYGHLTYNLHGETILSAGWQWAEAASPFHRHVQLNPQTDYLLVNRQTVTFHCLPSSLISLPAGWQAVRILLPGLLIEAAIVSLEYLFEEAKAA